VKKQVLTCLHNEDPTAPDWGQLGGYGSLYVCGHVVEPLSGEEEYLPRGPWCSIHRQGIEDFKLRMFQMEGVLFLEQHKRAMLTDAPGLGKTPQSAFAAKGRTLIVVPNYLTQQWYDWLCGVDEASLERNHGKVWANVPGTKAIAQGNRWRKFDAIRQHADWTVINIEMLGTHKEELMAEAKSHKWETLIIDESHHVKNHKSIRAKFAVQLGQQIERVYELTATPIWREVDDLYMQLRILWPDLFTSYYKFVDYWCTAEVTHWGTVVTGVKKSMKKELEELLNVVRIGRSYKDAGREIPPIIEKVISIPLPPDVQKMYDDMVTYYRLQIEDQEEKFTNWMQVFNALRRIITGSFKVDVVKELLMDEVRRSIIFSWYKDTAYDVGKSVDCPVVTGDEKDISERRRIAQGDKHVSATIASLSEGIDASDARTVIFAEENWTPGSNYQALSRIRRERQGDEATAVERNAEPVLVYYLQCKGTIDEVIHRRSKSREGTIKDLIREAIFH
jgi:SWI/SNF-related matrix-associated actin-dependent regulator 1 of chromatin subfamily A